MVLVFIMFSKMCANLCQSKVSLIQIIHAVVLSLYKFAIIEVTIKILIEFITAQYLISLVWPGQLGAVLLSYPVIKFFFVQP
jgi:hypothetical protein